MMKYYKELLISLLIIFFCNVNGLSQCSTIRLVYINDYLQGDQLELSVNKSIKNLPISFELAVALKSDFDSYSFKFGANYCFDTSEIANFSLGFRTIHARFDENFSGNRQMATYFDFPIRVDFKLSNRVFSTLTIIPTYNTYSLLNDKIVFQVNVGLGYNF